jgi:acetyltransferase-like isoleucine patch superfamily enzyme
MIRNHHADKPYLQKINWLWAAYWVRLSGPGRWGRFFTRIGTLFIPPYYERHRLARMSTRGYFAPSSQVYGRDIRCGKHVFIDDRVLLYQGWEGGAIILEDGVHLHRDCVIQTGNAGYVHIGVETKIQLRCHFSSFKGAIKIGSGVQIAPNCSFFSYNHVFAAGVPIRKQELLSKGDIVIGDDVWMGTGVIVLDGVKIGSGAVIGAGSVVASNVSENAIVAGVPAVVKKFRSSCNPVTAHAECIHKNS